MDLETYQIYTSWDVRFDEEVFPFAASHALEDTDQPALAHDHLDWAYPNESNLRIRGSWPSSWPTCFTELPCLVQCYCVTILCRG